MMSCRVALFLQSKNYFVQEENNENDMIIFATKSESVSLETMFLFLKLVSFLVPGTEDLLVIILQRT